MCRMIRCNGLADGEAIFFDGSHFRDVTVDVFRLAPAASARMRQAVSAREPKVQRREGR